MKRPPGRPKLHQDGWRKVTVVLSDPLLARLDALIPGTRQRAGVVRALLEAALDSGMLAEAPLTDESALKQFLLERLQRTVRPGGAFLLVIQENGQHYFDAFGPFQKEAAAAEWVARVTALRQQGRPVTWSKSTELDEQLHLRLSAAGYAYKAFRQWYAAPVPRTTPAEEEPLPAAIPRYAQNAKPHRLVRIFCRHCNQRTWAEMTQDYPGGKVLLHSKLGDYKARCLRCSTETIDGFGWARR